MLFSSSRRLFTAVFAVGSSGLSLPNANSVGMVFVVAQGEANESSGGSFVPPPQTGRYITGVHDIEFDDATYPLDTTFDLHQGYRRIMARIYYPSCLKSNFDVATSSCDSNGYVTTFGEEQPRQYQSNVEIETVYRTTAASLGAFVPNFEALVEYTLNATTHSYEDAPFLVSRLDNDDDTEYHPLVVFSHGLFGVVSIHTYMLEELASHGMIVVR